MECMVSISNIEMVVALNGIGHLAFFKIAYTLGWLDSSYTWSTKISKCATNWFLLCGQGGVYNHVYGLGNNCFETKAPKDYI